MVSCLLITLCSSAVLFCVSVTAISTPSASRRSTRTLGGEKAGRTGQEEKHRI